MKTLKYNIIKNIRNDSKAFQPARDNPNILNITSSHLIGDLFNRNVRVSFEKSILEEQSSGPFQKFISIPKCYNPAIELASHVKANPISKNLFAFKNLSKINIDNRQ